MKVATSSLALESTSLHRVTETHQARLEVWAAPPAAPLAPQSSAPQVPATTDAPDEDLTSVETSADKLLVEWLLVGKRFSTGTIDFARIEATAPSEATQKPPQPPAAAGQPQFGASFDAVHTRVEQEGYAFRATGLVELADGRKIALDVSAAQVRQTVETSEVHLRVGAAKKQDPLVVNLAASTATLSNQKVDFDLNGDGKTERISTLGPGSVFLALDRNGNSAIDDGRELFGPSSGNSFGELSALDADKNGWIDELDESFSALLLFRPETGMTQSLAEAGIGALSTASAQTRFGLEGGEVARTGLYLREDGGAGTLQHLDLEV